MRKKWKVWFVDDLPENLAKFRSNHKGYYSIDTFKHPLEVMRQIRNGNYPDALLCDIFFYDTVREATRVEAQIDKLSRMLKRTAKQVNANDHSRTLGINLMQDIFRHFNRRPPSLPDVCLYF